MTKEQNDTIIEVIKIILPLIGGGAVGAIITALVTSRRNRIQPISKHVNITNIFVPSKLLGDHITRLTFSGATTNYDFENLFIAQIELENRGNKDWEQFEFGITLPENVYAININAIGKDRHHSINYSPEINFEEKSNVLDIKLHPFNRKDVYSITLFLTSTANGIDSEITFSSKSAVKFMERDIVATTTVELFLVALLSIATPGLVLRRHRK
ncbi:hypothetical protein [Arcticibacter tournemirensis]|uniref:Uncharacterized protein n=1 Tax=Arcticibacter tournemirensis TaxID=699437 RepID=A0A4Q0MB58_9SPHI|nr:hypothetical protein [Arcticibacter tournemirensis]RXF70521.1 hypothetical protein EKH83_07715 [Arcticibacter tournemirensis]